MTGWELTDYIIDYRNQSNKPISNLHLQKVLYLVNNEYYKRNGVFLLTPTNNIFIATPYGPIIPSIYKELQWYWRTYPITKCFYSSKISSSIKDEQNIQKDIDKYSDMNIFDLIKLVTASGIVAADIRDVHRIPISDIKLDIKKGDF